MFKMNASTVSVTDYKILNPGLARVVLSFTGKHDSQSVRAAVAEKFDGLATIVENTFKMVRPGVAVGFLRANRETRAVPDNALQAQYRLVSSNMVMDTTDKSLWTVQQGAAGKYLTRKAQENLAELVEATVHRTPGVPGLRHMATARAAQSELVAFVTDEGSVDYGFAVKNSEDKVRVVSYAARMPRTVDYDRVISIYPIQVDAGLKKQLQAALTPDEKKDAVSYWSKLYGFAPEYMQEVIRQVEEDTVA
jgi:hypothetical protein